MNALWTRLPSGLRDTALYGASLGWTKALAMLTLPLLTAMLSPADFARLELLSSTAEIGALFAGAGLVDTAYRFASGDDAPARRAAAEILGLGAVIALVGIVSVLVFGATAAAAMPLPTLAPEMYLLGAAVALEAAIGVPLAWLRMRGRAAAYAGVTALRATLQAGLVVACVGLGFGVAGVLAGGAVAAVAMAVFLMQRQARETGIALAPRGWGRLLAYGVPLIGSGLASFVLGTADRWLLAGVVPAAALGQYALAAKIALIAALLTQPFELWWYPRRLALLSAPGGLEKSARIVAAGLVLTILAAGATSVVGPLLIRLLTPVSYHAAAAFIPWIAAAIALQSMGSLVNVGCYTGRTGAQPMLVNGIAALVALVLYLALIPNHGVAGAVGATVLAQAVRFALFAVLSQRRVRLPWRPWTMLAPIAMSSAAAWVAQVEPGLAGGAACMALLTTGALAAAACGVFPTAWATRKLGRMAHV